MKITYTKHARDKFKQEKYTSRLNITKRTIKKVIQKPERTAQDGEKIIAIAAIDKTHSLVVVYKTGDEKVVVITFFPAKKGRYEAKIL